MGIATLVKSAEINAPGLHVLTEDKLQQLHGILLEMMNDIARLCQKNNIDWTLIGGSALGAVRHKGIIPWDDDIDIAMLRKDFEIFKVVFPGELSNKYELKLPGDEGYLYHFPKIYRKGTTVQNIQSAEGTLECVSIDLFVMESVSDNRIVRTLHGLLCTALLVTVSAMRMKQCKNNLLKYGANSKQLCNAVERRATFAVFFSFFTLEQWLETAESVFSLCKDNSSKWIAIPSGNKHFFGELFLREKMCTLKHIKFEGEEYRIIEDTDYYLRHMYGTEYLKIPEEKEREKHVYVQFDIS